jgi:HEAT repeat protein
MQSVCPIPSLWSEAPLEARNAIRNPEVQRDWQALARLLADREVQESAKLRRAVVAHLNHVGHPAATDAMIGLAEGDPDRKVRLLAMGTLRSSGTQASVPFLLATLRGSCDDGMRIHAIGALARLRETEAISPLIAALDDRSAVVRMAAGEALAAIGDPVAIPAMEVARRRARNPLVRSTLKREVARLRARQTS